MIKMKTYRIELSGYDGNEAISEPVWVSNEKPSYEDITFQAKHAPDIYRWLTVIETTYNDDIESENVAEFELHYLK